MLKCYEVCPWNYTCIGLGCKKPNDELCPMSNVGSQQKPKTNADRIRGMGDELLATQFVQILREGIKVLTDVDLPDELLDKFRSSFLEKLQQPAEGE